MKHQKSMDLQSYDLMKLPPREATVEGDLTIPFQQSALKSTADQDPFFQHLKIRYIKAADTADQSQVHCIALHCITLHCIALHCIALHCIALHCIVCIALHRIGCHCCCLCQSLNWLMGIQPL